MDNDGMQRIPRADFIALAASFIGAVVSIAGAGGVYISLAGVSTTPLWPLPGIVLLDWAILGILDLIAAYLVFRWSSIPWQEASWAFTGALMPLIILGAFSIGPLVLITFVLFVVSIVLLALCRKPKWLASVVALALGIIINLVLLLLVISIARTI